MGLKGNWVDKVDGESYVLSDDINQIAHAVIEQEEEKEKTTVDAALSEESENPVQNKVIAKKVREMDTAASGLTTRVEALEKSGGGSGSGSGGVSSWNDLTDKPFGEEIGEIDVLAEQTIEGFADDGSGMYGVQTETEIAAFVGGETYSVYWDGVLYPNLIASDLFYTENMPATVIGNLVFLGGEDTGEPFLFMNAHFDGGFNSLATLETSNAHTIRIFQEKDVLKPLDNKYLAILDGEAGTETDIFAEQTLEFTYSSAMGAYAHSILQPVIVFENGKEYDVLWDGVKYTRKAFAHTSPVNGAECVSIGNTLVAGGESNGDVFAVVCDITRGTVQFLSLEQVDSHTVRIYQSTPDNYKIKHEYPLEQPVSVDMSAFESEGKIMETFADGTKKTTVVELNGIGNPSKITDSDGNVIEFTW